ncbi:MAG: hypothetical protein ACRDRK_20400 [Pseudonocardia sp.]
MPSPLVPLDDVGLPSVRLLLKRDDLIGADLAGNTWRKLTYLLDDAATARHHAAHLRWRVLEPRAGARSCWKRDPAVLEDLRGRFGQFYLVPEGGTTPLALNGCAEPVAEIAEPFNRICCPVGTGGTPW